MPVRVLAELRRGERAEWQDAPTARPRIRDRARDKCLADASTSVRVRNLGVVDDYQGLACLGERQLGNRKVGTAPQPVAALRLALVEMDLRLGHPGADAA